MQLSSDSYEKTIYTPTLKSTKLDLLLLSRVQKNEEFSKYLNKGSLITKPKYL